MTGLQLGGHLILMIDVMSVGRKVIMLMTVIAIVVVGEAVGHGLDLIQDPEEGGTLAHAAEVVAEDPGLSRLADLDHFLLVDLDLSRHTDLVRVL